MRLLSFFRLARRPRQDAGEEERPLEPQEEPEPQAEASPPPQATPAEAASPDDQGQLLLVDQEPLIQPEPRGNGQDPPAADQGDNPEEEDDTLDPGLLDIFRSARNEVEESTLASELEDISLPTLLSELTSVGQRLGLSPRRLSRRREEEQGQDQPEPQEPEEPPAQASVPDLPPIVGQPAGPPEEAQPQPTPEAGDQAPAAQASVERTAPPVAEPAAPSPQPQGEPSPSGQAPQGQSRPPASRRRYVMHAFFLLLTLGAAATALGGGLRGPDLAARAEPAPRPRPQRVLGYLRPPVVPATLPGIALASKGEPMTAVKAETQALLQETPEPSPQPTAAPAPEAAPQATPESAPEATPQPPPDLPPAHRLYTLYTVQPGDTLSSIAEAFDICPEFIIWNNPQVSADLDLLFTGTDLIIPSVNGVLYQVQPGDTLADIAAVFAIDPESIIAFDPNGLSSAKELREGMLLLLPEAVLPSPPPAEPPAGAPGGYVWPWYGEVTSFYGEPRGNGYYHPGIDIAGLGYYGYPVVAAASGRVRLVAYQDWGLGHHVVIEHEDGSQTIYGHMSSIYVQEGQEVRQGEAIGALGCTGYSTGTHLHFELWKDGQPVDPLAYLP